MALLELFRRTVTDRLRSSSRTTQQQLGLIEKVFEGQ